MAVMALAIYLLFALLAIGWRAWRQYRDTADWGFRRSVGRMGSIEWFSGGCLLMLAALGGLVAFLPELVAGASRLRLVAPASIRVTGLALMAIGVSLTLVAQIEMAASWRIGLDPTEVTELVTTGLFRWVRNPIFAAMLVVFLGLALAVPNAISIAALIATLAGVEVQVRHVEEPYLIRVHGARYLSYAKRAGRFVPGLGRLN